MADETRSAGWYEDPWGTNDERYFDGLAWSRQTRLVGASDAPVRWPAGTGPVVSAGAADSPPVERLPGDARAMDGPPEGVNQPGAAGASPVPEPAVGPRSAPPGWHADPWRLATLRWWDGSTWTGHVSGPSAAKPADVGAERALARWVHPLLLVGGAVQALAMFANASQAKWFVENWDQMTTPGGKPASPPAGGSLGGSLGGLVFPVVSIAVSVLFLLWFYRAASTGWASGLPARRRPLLSTLSFVIPILNLWWPYQAAMDMVPAGDLRRGVIRRWWVLWLSATLCGFLIYPAQAIFDETAARVVASVGAATMVGAAFAAREVVRYVTATHEQLERSAATR